MTTQYTSILKLALPVQGELSGTWGDVVNDNITSMVEEAVAGRAVINTWTTNSHVLTTADGTTAESRCAMLEFTDTGTALTGAATVVCPSLSKLYVCKNDSGQQVTIKTSAGTGVAIPDGQTMFVFCDGTNVEQCTTNFNSLSFNDYTLSFGGAVTTAGAFTTSGAYALTLTTTGATNVTLPTTGTLATLDGTETLTNKTLTGPTISSPTLTGSISATDLTISGDTTIGDAAADGLTVNATITSNLIFTDDTYDIGASGATRPRNLFLSGNATIGGTVTLSGGIDVTGALGVDGDFDVNTDKFTVASATGNTLVAGTLGVTGVTTATGGLNVDTINEITAAGGVTIDSLLIKDISVGTADASGTDTAGTNVLVKGGASTGTGAGGSLVFQTTPAGTTGSTVNTQVTALTIDGEGDATFTGAITTAGMTTSADINFGDNDKAIFGAGSDLEIYHDGSDSYIVESGTGDLLIRGGANIELQNGTGTRTYATFTNSGDARLYYDSSLKLATTNTGIDVTGDVGGDSATISGDLTVDTNTLYVDSTNNRVGIGTSSPSRALTVYDASNSVVSIQTGSSGTSQLAFGDADDDVGKIYYEHTSNRMVFNTAASAQMNINASGRLSIGFGDGTSEYYQAPINVGSTESNIASFVRYASTQNGPSLYIGKSRSGTVGVNTVVQDGDDLGFVQFTGADGTNYRPAAQIQVEVDGAPGTDDMPGRLIFKTTPDGSITATERMRINNAGKVGINETDPQTLLHISSNDGSSTIRLEDADATAETGSILGTLEFYGNDTGGAGAGVKGRIWMTHASTAGDAYMQFSTGSSSANNVTAMTIDTAQRVLIGLTTSEAVASTTAADLQVETTGIGASIISNAGAVGPAGVLALGHKRGAGGVVLDGDGLGDVRFAGHDGTDLESQAAVIRASVDGTPGSDDMPGRLQFYTTADGASSSTERMRINSSGYVGINTGGDPERRLDVRDTSRSLAQFMSTDTSSAQGPYITLNRSSSSPADDDYIGAIQFVGSNSAGEGVEYSRVGGYMQDVTDATEDGGIEFFTIGSGALETRIRIDGSGRLLVGGFSASQTVGGAIDAEIQLEGNSANSSAMSAVRNSNDVNGPYFVFTKSRGSTAGAATATTENDYIGSMIFGGADGTSRTAMSAQIVGRVDGAVGTGDVPGRLEFWTAPDGSATPTERMRITNEGYVGINSSGNGTNRLAVYTGTSNGANIAHFMGYEFGLTKFTIKNAVGANNGRGVGIDLLAGNDDVIGRINVAHAGSTSNANMTLGVEESDAQTTYIQLQGDGQRINFFRDLRFPNDGDGINFGATSGGGSTSAILDDYEEGTWTPTYTASGGGTYNTLQNTGFYTKIGNLVTVTWWTQFDNPTGTLSGTLSMTGLPYASNGSTRASPAFRTYGWNSGSNIVLGYTSGGTNISWQYYSSGMSGIATNVPANWINNTGDELGGTLTYQI